jgi:pimeloyl-ACP methyl ester carboxylesterase
VFIHGLGGSSAAYYPLIKALSLPSDQQVINLDWEGHGLSPLSGAGLTVESLARSIVDVLSALKVDKAILVGHSFGGVSSAGPSRRSIEF